MDARGVKDCLRVRHPAPEWVWAEEFQSAPGYSTRYGDGRRIDGLAFNCYPSRGHLIIGYEVKISRGDFLSEIKRPEKRKTAVDMVDEFYFATPKGLLHPKEIPPDCGLIECYEGEEKWSRLKVRIKNHALLPYESEDKKINKLHPRWFMASVMRQFDPERVRKEKDLEIRTLKYQWNRTVDEIDYRTRKNYTI